MSERILIVSDQQVDESFRRALGAKGFETTLAADAAEGYRQMAEMQFDVVVVNLATGGADLIKHIRSNSELATLKVLTIAEWGSGQGTLALSLGADGFEPAPINSGRLVTALEKLLRPGMAMTAAGRNGKPGD